MKTLQIILAWLFIFPTLVIAFSIHKMYLWIKEEIQDFNEIVINQIK